LTNYWKRVRSLIFGYEISEIENSWYLSKVHIHSTNAMAWGVAGGCKKQQGISD